MVAALILGAYFLKGIGATSPAILMTDVGQRVVMDSAERLFRHMLDQSAAFFSRRTSGQLVSRITNDVEPGAAAVSETAPDLIRESLAVVGFAGYLFYLDWRLALVCHDGGAARRLSARAPGPARAADDAARPGRARARHAHRRPKG